MSEVQRYYVGKYGLVEGESLGRLSVVLGADFDRVTVERDALQQRLTAAGERADVLEGLLAKYYNRSDVCAFMAKDIGATLKPAEVQRNQCDGCQAGVPVVNGAHRMGKPGGYPDTMSCTAKLYKP